MSNSNELGITIPAEYHEMLYVGVRNRAGEIIDYKIHPVFIDSPKSLEQYKEEIFAQHTDINALPEIYHYPDPFIVLRPTAYQFRDAVKDALLEAGRKIKREVVLDNFLQLSDILYILSSDPNMHFTWKWRSLTKSLHESGQQDQNQAVVYILDEDFDQEDDYNSQVIDLRANIRKAIGSTPYLFAHQGEVQFGMDLHHLHAPDFDLLAKEYNALMHAINHTSVFSTEIQEA